MDFKVISFLVILGFVAIYFFVYFLYVFFYFLLPMFFWGAFFAKTDDVSLQNMIKLAKIKPGDIAVDLGSGDGKIVIAMAKAGAIAYGFEINPFLVWVSRIKIKKAGLNGKAFVYCKNFWKEDLSKYDVVMMFQLSHVMASLEKKLEKQLKGGTRVLAKYFVFPNWKAIESLGMINLYKK
jgi:ribosomal protein L11 methylase PrmA